MGLKSQTGVILDSETGLKAPKVSGLTALGRDHICRLGVTESSKASINILSPNSKVIFAARYKLCESARHRQGEGLYLPNLLPLGRHGGTRVLMVGIQMITVHTGTAPVHFHDTP